MRRPLHRRDVLVSVATILSFVTAGCFTLESGSTSVYVINGASESTLEVILSDDGEAVFEREYDLDPFEWHYEEDILPGGSYAVEAIVNDSKRNWYTVEMEECTEQRVSMYVHSDESVRFSNERC